MKKKVAVGLSGGVDSAVSAYLLKKQGFDVSGCYLHCFDDDAPGCRGKQDRQDALSVALHLKIPFRVLDFRRQYKSAVIAYFKKEYLTGRTPNPDVVCNRDIKFGLLLDWCVKNGFDYMATGHYADGPRFLPEQKSVGTPAPANDRSMSRASNEGKANAKTWLGATPILRIPKDKHKDQTYFLWAVPRQNFSRVLFPLADFRKKDVRSLAKFAKIPVADKPDSTGICFIGEVRVENFLKRLGVKEREGEVVIMNRQSVEVAKPVSASGGDRRDRLTILASQTQPPNDFVVVGRHRGVWFYTIGQRHGFTVDNWPVIGSPFSVVSSESAGFQSFCQEPTNRKPTNHKQKTENRKQTTDKPPLYVIEKDVRRNRLIVGFGAETYREKFIVRSCNWLVEDKFFSQAQNSKFKTKNLFVRIRHGGELIPCSLSVNSEQLTVNGDSPFAIHRSRFTVHLRFAQRGIAPGQSAVFYSKAGLVLGGGVIQ